MTLWIGLTLLETSVVGMHRVKIVITMAATLLDHWAQQTKPAVCVEVVHQLLLIYLAILDCQDAAVSWKCAPSYYNSFLNKSNSACCFSLSLSLQSQNKKICQADGPANLVMTAHSMPLGTIVGSLVTLILVWMVLLQMLHVAHVLKVCNISSLLIDESIFGWMVVLTQTVAIFLQVATIPILWNQRFVLCSWIH